jgi:hypothetical protein
MEQTTPGLDARPVLEPGRLDAIAKRHGAPPLAIELEGLRKVYAGSRKQAPKVALKGIDLAVPRGSSRMDGSCCAIGRAARGRATC